MRGTTSKAKHGRGPFAPGHGMQLGSTMGEQDAQSALKIRRNKKNFTAAQVMGKTTGRWTDEEHQRFNEGKQIQIFIKPIQHKSSFQ
jgi:hypothetical protein